MIVEPITSWANLVTNDDFIGLIVEETELLPHIQEWFNDVELLKHMQGFNLNCAQDGAISESLLKTFREYVIYPSSSENHYYILFEDQLVKFSDKGSILETFPLKKVS